MRARLLLPAGLLLCAAATAQEAGRTCFDGLDNDGDGTADCEDPECQTDPLAARRCGGARPTCNPTRLSGKIRALQRACCVRDAGDMCAETTTFPPYCSTTCAPVTLDFWDTCAGLITEVDAALAADVETLVDLCADPIDPATYRPPPPPLRRPPPPPPGGFGRLQGKIRRVGPEFGPTSGL